MVEVDVAHGEIVEILVETARDDVYQALHVRSPLGDLVAMPSPEPETSDDAFDHDDGLGFEQVTLQASRVPRLELTCLDTSSHSLQLWNSWLMGDSHHSWTGNSGIVAERLDLPPGASTRLRLWCSDGLGDPQFDDLVVVVTIGKVPAGEHTLHTSTDDSIGDDAAGTTGEGPGEEE